jgi:hypothetical protein
MPLFYPILHSSFCMRNPTVKDARASEKPDEIKLCHPVHVSRLMIVIVCKLQTGVDNNTIENAIGLLYKDLQTEHNCYQYGT